MTLWYYGNRERTTAPRSVVAGVNLRSASHAEAADNLELCGGRSPHAET
jgi:hypothetical protein